MFFWLCRYSETLMLLLVEYCSAGFKIVFYCICFVAAVLMNLIWFWLQKSTRCQCIQYYIKSKEKKRIDCFDFPETSFNSRSKNAFNFLVLYVYFCIDASDEHREQRRIKKTISNLLCFWTFVHCWFSTTLTFCLIANVKNQYIRAIHLQYFYWAATKHIRIRIHVKEK